MYFKGCLITEPSQSSLLEMWFGVGAPNLPASPGLKVPMCSVHAGAVLCCPGWAGEGELLLYHYPSPGHFKPHWGVFGILRRSLGDFFFLFYHNLGFTIQFLWKNSFVSCLRL